MRQNRYCAFTIPLLIWLSALPGCATGLNHSAETGHFLEMRPFILSGLRPHELPVGWLVVRSREDWTEFWSQHSFKPAPDIDFDQFTFVAVFLGQKPNPGYAVKITEAREYPDKVVVQAVQSEPSPGALYAQVIVYPYDAVLIPKTDKIVEFEMKKEEGDDQL